MFKSSKFSQLQLRNSVNNSQEGYSVLWTLRTQKKQSRSQPLTMGGVILHKVFGLLCCDHINVTHLEKKKEYKMQFHTQCDKFFTNI